MSKQQVVEFQSRISIDFSFQTQSTSQTKVSKINCAKLIIKEQTKNITKKYGSQVERELSRYYISERIDPPGYYVRFRFGRSFQSLCVLGVALDNLIREARGEDFPLSGALSPWRISQDARGPHDWISNYYACSRLLKDLHFQRWFFGGSEVLSTGFFP